MSELTLTKKKLIFHDWSKEDYTEYCRKKTRESQKRRRDFARANGLCSICCKNKVTAGYKTCQNCNSRAKIWQKENRGSKNVKK